MDITRGAAFERKTWLAKAGNRSLIESERLRTINEKIEVIGKMINRYINSVGDVKEPADPYGDLHPKA